MARQPSAGAPPSGISVTTEGGPGKVQASDFQFVRPNPDNLAGIADQATIERLKNKAHNDSQNRAEAMANFAKLPGGGVDAPNFAEMARERTLRRRKDMTPEELAIWECLRDPNTGVPPVDVRGTLGSYTVWN